MICFSKTGRGFLPCPPMLPVVSVFFKTGSKPLSPEAAAKRSPDTEAGDITPGGGREGGRGQRE